MLYECKICNFSSRIKTHLNRHLKTNKHIKNLKELSGENEKKYKSPSKIPQNTSIYLKNTSKTLIYTFQCQYCDKTYSRKDNLTRHEKICSENNINYKELFYELKQQLEIEKKEFRKNIQILLEKVGNTTINNTQNIQLNNYGREDMSHITDSLKTRLLKIPYGMIPKFIEAVHFSDKKPENKNIALTNKRDNMIRIFKVVSGSIKIEV